MGIFNKVTDLKNTFEGKLLAVFMAVVLVLSMVQITAFATSDPDGKKGEELLAKQTTELAPELGQALVSFKLGNSYASVKGQLLASNELLVEANKAFSFSVVPYQGYEIDTVTATDKSTGASKVLSGNAGTYSVGASDVSNNLVISAISVPVVEKTAVVADNEASTATPLVDQPISDKPASNVTDQEEANAGATPLQEQAAASTDIVYITPDNTSITATAPAGVLPADTEMHVSYLNSSSVQTMLENKAAEEDRIFVDYVAYDVSFSDAEGNDVQPNGKASITFDTPWMNPGKGEMIQILHSAGAIDDAQVIAEGTTAVVEHFSPYIVLLTKTPENATEEESQEEENEGTTSSMQQYTVTYYSNFDDYANGNDPFMKTVVDNEAPAPIPHQTPDVPSNYNNFVGWSIGWKIDSGAYVGEEFDFSTPITGNLDLVAEFSDKYFVMFKNAAGDDGVVYETQMVSSGDLVEKPAVMPDAPIDTTFQYWYIEGQDPQDNPFDLNRELVFENLTLVPYFASSNYVFFDSMGGNSVAAQFVDAGAKAIQPTKPTRPGYEFKFWSKNPEATAADTGQAYNFNTAVTDSFTLYGVWQAQKVGYILNVWNEKAEGMSSEELTGDALTNTNNYELVYTRMINPTNTADKTLLGTAGAALNNGTTDIINASFFTGRAYAAQGTAVQDILDYSEFAFTDAGDKVLSGAGDTVINLYAKRISYPIAFELSYGGNGSGGRIGTAGVNTVTLTTRGGETHSGDTEDVYLIHMKLDENITYKWPATYVQKGYENYKFQNWNGWHSLAPADADMFANKGAIRMGYSSVAAQGSAYGRLDVAKYIKMVSRTSNTVTKKEARYYFTEADASKVDQYKGGSEYIEVSETSVSNYGPEMTLLDNPTNYKLVKFRDKYYEYVTNGLPGTYQASWAPKNPGWPSKTFSGFQYIGQDIASYPEYRVNNYQVAIANGKLTATFRNDSESNGAISIGNICYFMPRISYALTLVVGDNATIPNASDDNLTYNKLNGYTTSVPYDQKVDLSGITVESANNFEGWYLDEELTQKVDEVTMPAAGLTLYAGYTVDQSKVTYYSKANNGSELGSVDVNTGTKTSQPSYYEIDHNYDLGTFVGWGYYYKGRLVSFDFDKMTVDQDIDLYGLWKTTSSSSAFKITYANNTAGAGGTVPVDNNTYQFGVSAEIASGSGLVAPSDSYFIGWRVNDTGRVYYPGSSILITDNTELVALYVNKTIQATQITFNPNYSPNAPSAKTIPMLADTSITVLNKSTFTRDGYTFAGWSLTSGDENYSSIDYPFGSDITVSAPVTLYAVWNKIPTYTITYKVADGQKDIYGYLKEANSNGEIVYSDIVDGTVFSKVVSSLPEAIANEGYTFVGWSATNPLYVKSNLTFEAIFSKDLTLSIGDGTKVYGNEDPNNFGVTVSCLDHTGWPTFIYTPQSGDLTRETGKNVGDYVITLTTQGMANVKAALAAQGSINNYVVAKGKPVQNGTFTITPREVTVTAGDATGEFGNGTVKTNKWTASGLVDDADIASVTVGGEQYYPGYSASTIDSVQFKDDTTKANYTVKTKSGTLTVTGRNDLYKINATAASGTYTYDAAEKTANGVSFTTESGSTDLTFDGATYIVEGLSASASATNASETDVLISGTPAVYDVRDTDKKNNLADQFNIAQIDGKLLIEQAQLTITANSATKTYDGVALTEQRWSYEVGNIKGDNASAKLYGNDEIESVTIVGSQTEYGSSGNVPASITFNKSDIAGNYKVTFVEGTLTVNKASLAVLIYGNTAAHSYAGTLFNVDGFTTSTLPQDVDVDYDGDASVSGTNAGTYNMDLAVADFTLTGEKANNYDVTFSVEQDGKLTINKVSLVITVNNDTKVYDGQVGTVPESLISTSDLVGSEYFDATEYDLPVTSDANAATYHVAYTPEVKEAIKADFSNYIITFVGGQYEIAPLEVTVTANSTSKEYDGTALTDSGWTNTPLVGSDKIASVTVSGQRLYTGFEPNIPSNAVFADGVNTDNYKVVYENGTLEVTDRTVPYAITLIPVSETIAYNGSEQSIGDFEQMSFEFNGKIYTVSEILVNASGTNAATYPTVSQGTALVMDAAGVDVTDQFSVTVAEGSLTITPIPLTITANNETKVVDTDDPALTYEYSGAANDETLAFTGALSRDAGESIGIYAINRGSLSLAGEGAGNYEVTFVPGRFEITPAVIVTPVGTETIEGGTPTRTGLAAVIVPIATVMADMIDSIAVFLDVPPTEQAIDHDATPLASNLVGCWVHYYIVMGILVSAIYAVTVVFYRRRCISVLDSQEETVLQGNLEDSRTSGKVGQPNLDGHQPAGNK